MREFKVNKSLINSKHKKCLVCEKEFKLGEKIVLAPIQGVKEGWGSVIAIPIHSKCYWVKKH